MKSLLVSLISDQTIPNVQLIKEFPETTDYLFITTKGMERKGVRRWIINTSNIKNSKEIIVDEFSFEDIINQLSENDFEIYDKVFVNITGGTKIMTLAAYEFFKEAGVQGIYYITGKENEYVKLFPKTRNKHNHLLSKVSIDDYLHAYGFNVKKSNKCIISFDQTTRIFNSFCQRDMYKDFSDEYKFLFSKRGKVIKGDALKGIELLLNEIGFVPEKKDCLSENEIKYLTGDWFEEYVGNRIKNELDLEDSQLLIGAEIFKEISPSSKNDVAVLLNMTSSGLEKSVNEIDVMFIYKNQFYSIECKTSIIDIKLAPNTKGEMVEKEVNILGETLYKSDSLKNKFGLFAKTTIMTMTNFESYINDKDLNKKNNKTRQMEEFIGRANLSNIKLVDKSMLNSETSLYSLIK